MKNITILFSLFFSSVALAGASGDSPSVLLSSGVNFFILILGFVFLLKSKASIFFTEKSTNVSEMISRAASKAKEAQEMMEEQKRKTSTVESQIKEMEQESESFVASFEKTYKEEVDERISNLKKDADQKVEAEKKELLNELNSSLLDLVVAKAKEQIKSNPSLAKNAADNIFKGL